MLLKILSLRHRLAGGSDKWSILFLLVSLIEKIKKRYNQTSKGNEQTQYTYNFAEIISKAVIITHYLRYHLAIDTLMHISAHIQNTIYSMIIQSEPNIRSFLFSFQRKNAGGPPTPDGLTSLISPKNIPRIHLIHHIVQIHTIDDLLRIQPLSADAPQMYSPPHPIF